MSPNTTAISIKRIDQKTGLCKTVNDVEDEKDHDDDD